MILRGPNEARRSNRHDAHRLPGCPFGAVRGSNQSRSDEVKQKRGRKTKNQTVTSNEESSPHATEPGPGRPSATGCGRPRARCHPRRRGGRGAQAPCRRPERKSLNVDQPLHRHRTFKRIQYFMPCHVMSCDVMPCHAMPCHAMPCHAMPCHAMSCHVMSCHVISGHAMPCRAVPCRVASRRVASSRIKSHQVVCVVSGRVGSGRVR